MTTRICPTDGAVLIEERMGNERVDVCPTCSGAFFDDGELERINRLISLFEKAVLDEDDIPSVPDGEIQRAVTCPADGEPMHPQEVGGVIIDVCSHCGGYWLDGGELAALRLVQTNIEENLNLYIRLGN